MRLSKKLMTSLLGLFLLAFPSCDQSNNVTFRRAEINDVQFTSEHREVGTKELTEKYKIGQLFPPKTVLIYPAFSADLNNDGKEDLIIREHNVSYFYGSKTLTLVDVDLYIFNDYFSVLRNRKIQAKRQLPYRENVTLIPFIIPIMEFRDVDRDEMIEPVKITDDSAVCVLKIKNGKYEGFLCSGGENGQYDTTAILYDFDGDEVYELFENYRRDLGGTTISGKKIQRIVNGKVVKYILDYRNPTPFIDAVYRLRNKISESSRLSYEQKMKNIRFLGDLTGSF
jgi:hypothetical protein